MFGTSAFAANPFASIGGEGDVVIGITGVQANGYVGTMANSNTVTITGVSANGSVGTPLYFYWTTIDDNETPDWQNVAMTV
jgi:hypothetical protein